MRKLQSCFLLLVIVAATSAAQNPNNMIRGKVRATNGSPVNNAIVELHDAGGALLSQTVTRNDGDFAFSRVVPAEYEISVTVSGFHETTQRVLFTQSSNSNFYEVLNVEIMVRPITDNTAVATGVSFVQDVPKAARAAYEKAVERLRDGKPDEGMALLREAIGIFNQYFDANFALARELYRTGKDQEALEAIERARQVNEREGAVYHLFGMIMLRQQKFKVAEFAFREAVRFNANLAPAHFFHGKALIELALRTKDQKEVNEDLTDAEKDLNRAWELSGKRMSEVHFQRARIYERRGNKEAAAVALEEYLKAEPNAPNAAMIKQAIEKLRAK